jgi:hypothetical protein
MNYRTLQIFAPLLILVGILGFIIPPQISLVSGATPYNIFHIIFGVIGLVLLITKSDQAIGAFNIGFGAIDLYQALASFTHIFPESYFKWTRLDDILHIVIGAGLVIIGVYGNARRPSNERKKDNAGDR